MSSGPVDPSQAGAGTGQEAVASGPAEAGPEDVDASQRPDVAREHDQEGDLENPGAAI